MPRELRCPLCHSAFEPRLPGAARAECPDCGEVFDPAATTSSKPRVKAAPVRDDRDDDDSDDREERRPRRRRRASAGSSGGGVGTGTAIGTGATILVVVVGVVFGVVRATLRDQNRQQAAAPQVAPAPAPVVNQNHNPPPIHVPQFNPPPVRVPRPTPPPGPLASPDAVLGVTFDPLARDAAPAGGLLVGLEVGLDKFFDYPIVGTLRPIYRAGDVESVGGRYGVKGELGTRRLVAKPGYAVGAVTARTGLGIDGLSVTFMRVSGDRLDPADAYESEWAGNTTGGGGPTTQTGHGAPVVGLLCHHNRERAAAVGLVFRR